MSQANSLSKIGTIRHRCQRLSHAYGRKTQFTNKSQAKFPVGTRAFGKVPTPAAGFTRDPALAFWTHQSAFAGQFQKSTELVLLKEKSGLEPIASIQKPQFAEPKPANIFAYVFAHVSNLNISQ